MRSQSKRIERNGRQTSLRRDTQNARIDIEAVFAALDDPDCREILVATTDEALTARELVDHCEMPRSTTYRKVEQLTEAGLLEEKVRIKQMGKHPNEYRRAFEALKISLSASNDFEIGVSRTKSVLGD